jgi:catechol 2,3-dioxygenase-like lactoylglutathione lyase family enzyme
MTISGARFGHTNLIARDWRKLAAFYQELFGCVVVPPERDYAGADLEAGTGVPGSTLKGAHLRLPGHGPDGPTLEIYSYSVTADALVPAVNRPGFGHICFIVDSVPKAHAAILAAGGRPVAKIVTLSPAPGTRITWCYVTDPEGNIIELQSTERT